MALIITIDSLTQISFLLSGFYYSEMKTIKSIRFHSSRFAMEKKSRVKWWNDNGADTSGKRGGVGENFWGCLSTCTTPNSSRVLVGVVKWYEKTGIYGINSLYYSRYQTINNNYSKEYQTKSDRRMSKIGAKNLCKHSKVSKVTLYARYNK